MTCREEPMSTCSKRTAVTELSPWLRRCIPPPTSVFCKPLMSQNPTLLREKRAFWACTLKGRSLILPNAVLTSPNAVRVPTKAECRDHCPERRTFDRDDHSRPKFGPKNCCTFCRKATLSCRWDIPTLPISNPRAILTQVFDWQRTSTTPCAPLKAASRAW